MDLLDIDKWFINLDRWFLLTMVFSAVGGMIFSIISYRKGFAYRHEENQQDKEVLREQSLHTGSVAVACGSIFFYALITKGVLGF